MMMIQDYQILKTKKAQILKIAEQYGALNIRVFGSVIRGEATKNSDIDFLVDFKPGSTLLDQIGLIQSLQDLLGCPIDIIEENTLHEVIKKQVLQDAIPL